MAAKMPTPTNVDGGAAADVTSMGPKDMAFFLCGKTPGKTKWKNELATFLIQNELDQDTLDPYLDGEGSEQANLKKHLEENFDDIPAIVAKRIPFMANKLKGLREATAPEEQNQRNASVTCADREPPHKQARLATSPLRAIKSPGRDLVTEKWSHYWAALKTATVTTHSDVNEVVEDKAVPYQYSVLTVDAVNALTGANVSKFLIRRSYTEVWEVLEKHIGRGRCRLLVLGPSGIGKTTALGTGLLLYRLRQRMDSGGDSLEHVVHTMKTKSGFSATVFSAEKVVHLPNASQTNSVWQLFFLPKTVWIMDDEEHGPNLQTIDCVCVQISSPDEKNFTQGNKKHAFRKMWIGAFGSQGRMSDVGLPVELHALAKSCFGTRVVQQWKTHYDLVGPIPRHVQLPEQQFQAHVTAVMTEVESMSAEEVISAMTVRQSTATVRQIVKYACVDPTTMLPTGSALVPCAFKSLLRRKRGLTALQVAGIVEQQLELTGSHQAVGKGFEEALLTYLNTASRQMWCSAPILPNTTPSRVDRCMVELPHEQTNESTFDGVETQTLAPILNRVSSLKQWKPIEDTFASSTNPSEPAIDFEYSCKSTPKNTCKATKDLQSFTNNIGLAMQGQVTLSPRHPHDGDVVFLKFEKTLESLFKISIPAATEELPELPKLCFALVTTYASAGLLRKRPLTSKIKNPAEKQRRLKFLAQVEHVVLTPPQSFLKGICRPDGDGGPRLQHKRSVTGSGGGGGGGGGSTGR